MPLPGSLIESLDRTVAAWQLEPNAPELRWTAAEGRHLTLAFLGSTAEEQVPAILSAVRAAVAGDTAWSTRSGGLGTFPVPRRARVVWYGISDPHGRLARLAASIAAAVEPMAPGLRRGQPFRPHVTLARARDPRGADLGAWLEAHRAPDDRLAVDRVVLFRSHLGGPGPARYEALGSVTLGTPAGGMMDAEAEASVHE